MVNLFTVSGRISRSEFVYGTAILTVAGLVLAFVAGFAMGAAGISEDSATGFSFVLGLAATVLQCMLVVRRLHDLGKPGWHLLLFLVPLYGIYLWLVVLFTPGKPARNAWGAVAPSA